MAYVPIIVDWRKFQQELDWSVGSTGYLCYDWWFSMSEDDESEGEYVEDRSEDENEN